MLYDIMIYYMKLDCTSKCIIALLGITNEPILYTHIPLYLYHLKFIFNELDKELTHNDLKSHTSIVNNKIHDLISMGLIIIKDDKLYIESKGRDLYNKFKPELNTSVIDYTKDTMNCLTFDEFLALVYFSHKELIIDHDIHKRLTINREKLAISMYLKDSITIPKAASIADKDLELFFDKLLELKNKGLLYDYVKS